MGVLAQAISGSFIQSGTVAVTWAPSTSIPLPVEGIEMFEADEGEATTRLADADFAGFLAVDS